MMSTDFLREYFCGTEGRVYLGALRNPKSTLGRGEVAKLVTRNSTDIAKFIAEHDKPEREVGIYYCTATLLDGHTTREAGSCRQFPSLFADCDDHNHELNRGRVIELLEALECPPTMIVDSGHGLQPHWLLSEPSEDAERIIAARKKLQAILASDAVHDAPRYMRLPGSHNSKGGDWLLVEVVVHHPERRYTLEVLEGMLDTAAVVIPRKAKATKGNGAASDKPFIVPPSSAATDHKRGAAWARKALEESARELANAQPGARHGMLLKKANRMATMVARGWIDSLEVQHALFAAAEACGEIKEYGIEHFNKTFADGIKHGLAMPHSDLPNDAPAAHHEPANGHNGYQQEAPPLAPGQEPAAPPRQLIKSSNEFVAGFVPPEYVVVGLLQRRFIYSNTGQTGGGKTAATLRLAASTALGIIFAGRETKKVHVLYAAAENPDDVRMRWIALAAHMGFDVTTIEVYFTEGTFKISQMAAKLRAEAEKRGGDFGLVIVDTGPAFFEGDDENSRSQMGNHARQLRSLINIIPGGPCVVVNCHPTKNAGPDNLLPAGGGTFLNEMDGNLTCARNDSITEMHWQGKFRGPDFAPMHFLIKTVTHQDLKDSDGRLIPTVICEHISDQAQEDIAAAAQRDENAVLKFISENPKASQSSVATAMGWKYQNGDPNKAKASRHIKTLIKDKLIKETRVGRYVLTDEGKRVLNGEIE